jgi:hypothetical protein
MGTRISFAEKELLLCVLIFNQALIFPIMN